MWTLFPLLVLLVGAQEDPHSRYCTENKCFLLFRNSLNFTRANASCAQLGGQLMRVGSSVEQDTLSLLVGNLTASYWIGLHLPACPDSTSVLHGYKWVNSEWDSSFQNWGESFDGSCRAHQCVSVSTHNDLQWVQTPCEVSVEGFLCERSFTDPCTVLFEAGPVSYVTPQDSAWDLFPPGTITTRVSTREKFLCYSGSWLLAPWNCEIQNGGCEHGCTVDTHNWQSCYCPHGHVVHPLNRVTCEPEIPGSACELLDCEHACHAEDSPDPYCVCPRGFQLAADGRSCVDFDECVDKRQCPGVNSACVNTLGSFRCECAAGFRLLASQCLDVDECLSAPCEHDCLNHAGGYTCACYEGYAAPAHAPDKCELFCGEEECAATCDPNNPTQCFCPEGYLSEEREEGTFCVEINECEFSFCDQFCRNTRGSFVCWCNHGYRLVGEVHCVREEGEEPGMTPTPEIPLTTPTPTRVPSTMLAIIVCVACFVVLLFFLLHVWLNRRREARMRKAAEDS